MDYLNQLNDSQRQAVLYNEGPSLVVAGAGSGKTRVLTYKIAHLLQTGYQPHTILALTFTNKAAREMKQRISSVSDEYIIRYLWVGTFHSIFYRILRREAEHIGFSSDFTIYDSSDSKNLVKTIIKEMQLDDKIYRPGMVQGRISNAKNALITCNAYSSNHDLIKSDMQAKVPLINEIYKRYQSRCFNAGAMDFDELLLQTNILFRDYPQVLSKYQEQFRYVLVDEYQDTNFAQHLIVTRLCEKHKHIFVVGDDAQSIYSFRGANIDNMLRFKEHYPTCKVFKMEQNYRSTQNIVDAANSLIAKNVEQIKKTVYSEKEKGNKITVLSSYSDYEESYLVSARIMDMMNQNAYAYSDFAVLYRTNAQSRVLEETMRKRTIPYKVYGSQSFYQRKEIKDVIAYLRTLINRKDEEALKRIINYPARGIGNTTVGKLQKAAVESNISLWSVISAPLQYSVSINKGTEEKLKTFREMIAGFQEKNKAMNAAEIVEYTIKQSGIANHLFQDMSIEGISRQENIQEFMNAVGEFVSMRREEGVENVSLADFLMEVSLLTDQDNDKEENTDKVTMMTVHASKGLEFKNVFIVGMENDLFPSQRSMGNPRAVEEERRLFYVALTRAQQNCVITHAQNRFKNGQNNTATPSFFINDIEQKYLDYANEIMVSVEKEQAYSSAMYNSGRRIFPRSNNVIQPGKTTKYTRRLKKTQSGETTITETVETLSGFTVGDDVLHERFGKGQITALEGAGSDAKATVEFKNAGVKKLLLKFAKLRIV